MKATGIVRRIDELGRVVIPKEIRRTQHIRVGDALEIFVTAGGEVVFKKYSMALDSSETAENLCEAIYKTTGMSVLVTDRDNIVAASGNAKSLVGIQISEKLSDIVEARRCFAAKDESSTVPVCEVSGKDARVCAAAPILCQSDLAGSVALLWAGKAPAPQETQFLTISAAFLARSFD